MTPFIVRSPGGSTRRVRRAAGWSRLARIVRGAFAGAALLATGSCLDDTPVGTGSPHVRATLHANVIGVAAGGTVSIRVGYRASRENFVALRSTPERVDVPAGTTVVVPLTVDIGPCLADEERISADEGGCRLTIELTLADAAGGVIDTQTRDAAGAPATPGQSVDFGTVTVGVNVSSVTIAPTSLSLNVTQQQVITATVRDVTGAIVTSVPVSWTTSDATVAQLVGGTENTITVRALKLGSATVAASAGGRTSNPIPVSVVPAVPLTIRQQQGAGCIIVGQTITLQVDSPPGPVTWTSASPTTASVVALTGVVTGVAVGQVEISAASGVRTGSATVCVTGPLRVSTPTLSIAAARTGQVVATGVSGGVLSYSSNAPTVASVDATGLVRGLTVGQAIVTTTFTAPSGTQTATTNVTVLAGSVALTPTSGSAALTRTTRYTAVVRDANGATLPNVSAAWTIDDATVGGLSAAAGAAVDVQALKIGSTVVRATAGGASSSATFTATAPLPASRLEKVSGDNIACATHSTGCTFVVRAVDANGVAVAGAPISWSGTAGCPAGPQTTSDAQGLATATNVCSAVAPGAYTQTATLQTNQQQALFTFTLRGLALTSAADTTAIFIDITSSTATAQGLVASVRYRTGPIQNYFTSMQLDRTFTPATLRLGWNFFNLPFGNYTFEVTVTTTTAGVGPAIQTFGFVIGESFFIQPRLQRLEPAVGPLRQPTSGPVHP